ncbi:MAG: HAMP domain-containing protein [Candidatus Zixiibacteriota bacterium]|nr:MAG: HAMP domain-containing protein [candidate division Zixibacteria bacterium]
MKLRLRITLLLIVAAILPMIAVFVSLNYYAVNQRQSLVDIKLNSVYGGAVSLYERKGGNILSQMNQLAEDPILLRYLLVRNRDGFIDQQGLITFASEMKNLLNLDLLVIVDRKGIALARGHDPGLFGDNLVADPVFAEVLKGRRVQSLNKATYAGEEYLTSMGLAPIWYENRELVGAIAGGEFLDNSFCRDLQLLSGAEILLVEGNDLLAKTIPGRTEELLLYLQEKQRYRTKIEGLTYTFSRYPLLDFSGEKVADLLMGVSTQDLDVLFDNMQKIYGGFALGGLLLAIIFGYIFSSRLTNPIYKLIKASDRLASGDFSARIDYGGRGELGNLTDTFNEMASDLQAYRNKLVETERLSAFTMMARKVAHEIKNPLTPIRIAIEDLRRSYSESGRQFDSDFENSTRTVLDEVTALTKIVDEFSEFARFPAPKPDNDDLNEIVLSAVSIYPREIESGSLKTDLSSKPLPVYADRDQVKRALMNVIKNGLEAVPPGGRVTVRTVYSERKATVIVADNGHGLTESARKNLFTPYFTTKPGGSGLGLVIVKKIVTEHDGGIRVIDSMEGGTAVIIDFPLKR